MLGTISFGGKMEKDLRDYVSVLLKHKVLIISMTLIALILAFVLNFFIFSPVYRGSASVYIAQINNNPILKPKDVQALVTGDSFLQKSQMTLMSLTRVLKIVLV